MKPVHCLALLHAIVAQAAVIGSAPVWFSLNLTQSLQTFEDDDLDIPAFLQTINATLLKYHVGSLAPLPNVASLRRRAGDNGHSEDLIDIIDLSGDRDYLGQVIVGKNQDRSQQFRTIFDTGSSTLVVPGPKCGDAEGCPGINKYNENGIDTGLDQRVTYEDGSTVTGRRFTDDVTVAGYTASNTALLSVSQAHGLEIPGIGFASVLGMGLGVIPGTTRTSTWFENLVKQNIVPAPEFAFYFGRVKSNTHEDSLLTVGGRDTTKFYGPLTTCPVSNTAEHWQILMDDVKVSGVGLGPAAVAQATIDTGTNIVFAPTAAADTIFAQIEGTYTLDVAMQGSATPQIKAYIYPCWTAKRISFGFAAKYFALNPLDLNLGRFRGGSKPFGEIGPVPHGLAVALEDGRSYCTASIVGAGVKSLSGNAENIYIIGQSFLKNWYTIFRTDVPSVSFAAAKNNQGLRLY